MGKVMGSSDISDLMECVKITEDIIGKVLDPGYCSSCGALLTKKEKKRTRTKCKVCRVGDRGFRRF
jgi:hypothetical protein